MFQHRRQVDLRGGCLQDGPEMIPLALPGVNPGDFLEVLQDHIKRPYEMRDGVLELWRNLPEIPSSSEILSTVCNNTNGYISDEDNEDDGALPVNVVQGPWPSNGDYIGAHYRLLREDAIAPLRDAVAEVRAAPTMLDSHSVCIYIHVHIVGYTYSNQGPAPRVEFSTERAGKRIRWKQSKRLQQGTMVAISTMQDMFQTICKVAIVAARPLQGVEQNPPQIDLFWGDPEDAEFDPSVKYIMVEARSGYFEATRHMLVAMQKLMTESFPLSNHLVKLDKDMKAPMYLEKQPFLDLSSLNTTKNDNASGLAVPTVDNPLENVNVLGDWPEVDYSSLDESQLVALKRVLTKQVAIVQGPPGTGKTFVSITALIVALKNWNLGDPPILVAAQTNHALDQLLLLIASHDPNFMRIGGRTSEENKVILERTLFNIRTLAPRSATGPFHNRKNAINSLKSQASLMQQDINRAMDQSDFEPGVFRDLGIITQEQFDSLFDPEWAAARDPNLPPGAIPQWLGHGQLIDSPTGCPIVNMGFEDEEDESDFEELNETEVEGGEKRDDDDIDALKGDWFAVKEIFTGRPHSIPYPEKKLKKILLKQDLWEIKSSDRGEVYRYMQHLKKRAMLDAFRIHMRDYVRRVQNVKVAKWQADATLIRSVGIKLIGCTTTGLSKYRGLLAALKPRILLVEEAAETLEGTVLAAMFESLQQLILVGDHQQLQAHCNVDYLDKAPYNLAVSMFERLVNNGIEYTMLNRQRRMISEIRELLNPFYSNLKDHPSVLDRATNRKPIPGMGGRDTYFFHHDWPESRDDASSRYNIDEAEMIVKFLVYLNFNGVDPSKVTILTFYNGQRKVLRNMLRKNLHLGVCGPFNVFTVDSYQGEENDVILLSLVRSNDQFSIGFLENKNRAVVSLSRARRGMYIFGNSIHLLASSAQSFQLWSTVTDSLRSKNRLNIDSGLPIVCSTHGSETVINEPIEWDGLTGGCRAKCDGDLPCGHCCQYNCHPFSHNEIICKEPCLRPLACGHGCRARCGDRCLCDCCIPPQEPRDTDSDGMYEASHRGLLGKISPTKYRTRRPRGSSRPANSPPPGSRAPSLHSSSSEAWNEWNADKADRQLEDERIHRQANMVSDIGAIRQVYNETHRPVTLEGGQRANVVDGVTKREVARQTSPLRNVVALSVHPDSPTSLRGIVQQALPPQFSAARHTSATLSLHPSKSPTNGMFREPIKNDMPPAAGSAQLPPCTSTHLQSHVLQGPSTVVSEEEDLISFD